jgi:hypothetical protein
LPPPPTRAELRASQDEAVGALRSRQSAAERTAAEIDEVRSRLAPGVKGWAEEHGKRKHLRTLLATLQNILWEGARWKPVSLGDLLDDAKMRKVRLSEGERGEEWGSMMTYKTCRRYTMMRVAGSATSAMRKPQKLKRVRNDEA